MIPRNHHRHTERGSIYLTALGVCVLVLSIGVAAILAARVDARTGSATNDFAEARLAARSGLELAMLTIYNDPYRRNHLGNGPWYTNKPIGTATFNLSAADPVDSDVTNGDNDPIILTSTGMKGSAKYVISMRMEISPRVGSCLEVSMCAVNNIALGGTAALTSDQTISSNTQVTGAGATYFNANVEAFKSIGGGTYTKSTKVTGLKRIMPDPGHVLDFYLQNGTLISYTQLLNAQSAELIANEKFETNTSGWYTVGSCTLTRSTSIYKEGLASLRVTGRSSSAAAAATDIPVSTFVPGHVYSVNFPVYTLGNANMQVVLTLTSTTGTSTCSTPLTYVLQNGWASLKSPDNAPLAPTWTGTLTKATVTVTSDNNNNKDYYLDGLSFKDIKYTNGVYVMERQLLTPTINPYGTPNPQGIYVINGGGKTVVVSNIRVCGTLVMTNCGGGNGGSGLQNSVIIEPAQPNFPALLTDCQLTVALSSTPLSEAALNANFNPPGAPYPFLTGGAASTNATFADTYPSAINGLLYAGDDMTLQGDTTINGIALSASKFNVNGNTLNLHYNNIYLNNPPPGFAVGTIQMSPVPGSWQRTTGP